MQKIRILDDFTVNQIAAGEIIERPSSIIKELIENSIDANSSSITIEIQNGGISFIRVTDNGKGMDKRDACLSFQRHATSKIESSLDLEQIDSLGFRGEALASIAAVSQVELFTRTTDTLSGIHIINHGGTIISEEEIGCPEGTTVVVRNLFYNTPARLKFLKSSKAETASISEMVGKLILARPEISFRYINQDKLIYHSPGNGSLIYAILTVYGKDIKEQVLEINKDDVQNKISLSGYLGMPSLARMNRNYQSFFVNGRYVKSPLLSQSIEEAYRSLLPIHHFPWAVLHLKLPANELDVNVHPAKTEIRFKNEKIIHELILQWINEILEDNRYIPRINQDSFHDVVSPSKDEITTKSPSKMEEQIAFHEGVGEKAHVYMSRSSNEKPQDKEITSNGMTRDYHVHNIDMLKSPFFRIVGRVFSTYAIVEGDDQIFFIDQHAAHERLIYEELNNSLVKQNIASQQLLPSVILEMSHNEYIIVETAMDMLTSLGFELQPFGGNTWAIRAIPSVLEGTNVKELFQNALDQWGGDIKPHPSIVLKPYDIMKIACKQAVKARDPLSDIELLALLKNLQSKNIPLTCPHGRPIVTTITKYELEKKFKRIQ